MPPSDLVQVAAVPRPANADPLLLAIEVNAYITSVSPCGPGLKIDVLALLRADRQRRRGQDEHRQGRKYSAAYFISVGRIFLPMYSGVRPTISPATNTVTMASTRMPYSPAPTPPGAISPSAMSISVIAPPNGVSESWNQFTAPVEVTVVDAANSEQAAGRTWSPCPRTCRSRAADARGAQLALEEGDAADGRGPDDHHHGDQREALPVVPDHLAERARQAERDEQEQEDLEDFMNGFGLSNGWAELALKKPPPLLPSSLMTSCEATAPPGMVW